MTHRLDIDTSMYELFTILGVGRQTSLSFASVLQVVVLGVVATICMAVHASTPIPRDLELSLDVKTDEGKQAVFAVIRARAAAQGFSCKDVPIKTLGHDSLIIECAKRSTNSPEVHSIVASDNLGLTFLRIDGYFGGSPEPVSSLVATIEHDVKQLGGIYVRAMGADTDRLVKAREEDARREFARQAMDSFRQMCAKTSPSQSRDSVCIPPK